MQVASEELRSAADTVSEAANRLREKASDIVRRSDDENGSDDGRGRARATADTLASVSDSLEVMAEGARASGLALRDRGRDAAKALDRGETILRKSGLPGAATHVALKARRNAGKIAIAMGAGLVGFLALRRIRGHDSS